MTAPWPKPTWDEYFGPRAIFEPMSGCCLWERFVDHSGYGRVGAVWTREAFAHRVSWELARGPIPSGMKVLHRCDVPGCVNPDHLFLGTQADNVADMIAKGRSRPPAPRLGSANVCARLNEDQVWAIRELLRHKVFSQRAIAEDFGVGAMTISRIANNQTWRHVNAV